MALLDNARVYVGTYSKYNNGSIKGGWLDLSDYVDKDDFLEACKELHEDEEDPEFMFQDYEVPDYLEDYISESHIDNELWEVAEVLDGVEDWGDMEWFDIQSYCNPDDLLYDFDEYFFDTFFSSPMEAARATCFGNVNWGDKYIYFNGYGNLETTNDIWDKLDKKELIEYYLNNRKSFTF